MKAGILTINGLNNYGNRLQNYAVFSSLLKLGVDSETLVSRQWKPTDFYLRTEAQLQKLMKQDVLKAQQNSPVIVRQLRFKKFNCAYIPERYLNYVHMPLSIRAEYDFFVTGSDQVWNPQFRDSLGQLENRLLQFAKPQQRICFSPSFGIDEFSPKWYPLYRQELCKYPYLNVREQSGADIIRNLTGRDAEVVLDPTFMIERDEWLALAKPLPGFNYEHPYILYYFLGSEKEEVSRKQRVQINRAVNDKGLQEHRLFNKEDRLMHSVGPSEFLNLIDHAELVCTDSFHATALSIILGKPFLLCNRKLVIASQNIDMSNRTLSLLNKLQLQDKLPANHLLTEEALWKTDYSGAYEVIKQERIKMNAILRKAMRLRSEKT